MQTTALYKTLGLAFGAMLLTACASKGDVNEGAGSESAAVASEAETAAVNGTAVAGEALEAEANEAQAALLEQTVFYFDFDQDLKSTRMNSSHVIILYAVLGFK